jgi:hypothetical protein
MTNYSAGPYTPLAADLIAQGFIVMGDIDDPDRFGNELLLLRRGETRVRFVRDPGQWFFESAAPSSDDWFAPVVWQALLDDELPPDRMQSDEEQCNLVVARFGEIDHLCRRESDVVGERLKFWQAARADARRARPFDG